VAILGELFGVKAAWHGPGDVSPIGHAANVALDLVSYNFGVQEYSPFSERLQEVCKGCPEMKDGYLYANETPGWEVSVGATNFQQFSPAPPAPPGRAPASVLA
jgi:mannonate dehydratase